MRLVAPAVGLILVVLLVIPPATAAPYLQHQVDAGRTGATPDPGPGDHIAAGSIDVAFQVQVPGYRAYAAPPLVIDGAVYVLTGIPGAPSQGRHADEVRSSSVFRIGVETANFTEVVELGSPATSWASDGGSLFVATQAGVEAVPMFAKGQSWMWPFPALVTNEDIHTTCAPLAVDAATVFIACTQFAGSPASASGTPTRTFVAAISATDGRQLWLWTSEDARAGSNEPVDTRPASDIDLAYAEEARALALAGPVAMVAFVAVDKIDNPHPVPSWVRAFDREQGSFAWSVPAAPVDFVDPHTPRGHVPPSGLVGRGDVVIVKGDWLASLDAASGESTWHSYPDQSGDVRELGVPLYAGTALAVRDDAIYVTDRNALFRVSALDGDVAWSSPRPAGTSDWEDAEGILLADEVLYVTTYDLHVLAYGAATGDLLADTHLDPEFAGTALDEGTVDRRVLLGLGDGVLAAALWDGSIIVLGRTAASIQPRVAVSNAYPAAGGLVRLNASGTLPGALDDSLEYRVDWGDGTVTDWQNGSVFEHAYQFEGEQRAALQARNEAGQTSSEIMLFSVGGSPPAEPNLVATAFARENQDLTFGILGIVIAIVGGLIAVMRRRRERGILQRELSAIDRAYEATKDDPPQCEAVLVERKARCRGLLMDGRLDESQFAVLAERIDELGRKLRSSTLDEHFQFLPYGMVMALRDMLSDGRISAWERQHVMRAVDEDDVLTEEQKDKVRVLVDGWFRRDSGANA